MCNYVSQMLFLTITTSGGLQASRCLMQSTNNNTDWIWVKLNKDYSFDIHQNQKESSQEVGYILIKWKILYLSVVFCEKEAARTIFFNAFQKKIIFGLSPSRGICTEKELTEAVDK